MKTLLIVWHSRTGGARQMAEAAAAAARRETEIVVRLVPAAEAQAEDVLGADGFLFVAPENLAALSGIMKDFFDRTYYPVLGRVDARPYATLIAAGSDGEGALRQTRRIVTGWRLREVVEPLVVCLGAQRPEEILAQKTVGPPDLERCRTVGATMAAGLAAGVF